MILIIGDEKFDVLDEYCIGKSCLTPGNGCCLRREKRGCPENVHYEPPLAEARKSQGYHNASDSIPEPDKHQ